MKSMYDDDRDYVWCVCAACWLPQSRPKPDRARSVWTSRRAAESVRDSRVRVTRTAATRASRSVCASRITVHIHAESFVHARQPWPGHDT
eukprot:3151541-Prymnesium_polylepis.1